VFDLSVTKLLVLAVIALVVFGPHELPKIASQAGKMLRDLRRIADGAKADLREGLGPEFQDFDFDDLHPRKFVQKHLMDEPGAPSVTHSDFQPVPDPALGGMTAAESGAGQLTLLDGAEPPFDLEAT
jgi:sec-independent protein translocase protein TatB